ncbi:uncharacterized protein CcaverHIS019_0504810 [Cutaneotrichosporon cavernicola]|uniref:uracil phosphoribosyltransferase n=1 Tax=Cutaneotrichosporon cavernicola TaxID=279322 RepID=A0AA48QWZ2_9TREE|nr:uncharacterized protein CcaverHIS019_0504810 [Cutaneotrichosporon cavernicola]BEI92853.1 hypothetical protein CcaverHIS019_0504810 [Cutaneotrichosporon cavernicola]
MSTQVHVSDHPLIATQLTRLRLHDLPPAEFRHCVKAISSMLMYEAARDVPLADVPDLRSPIAAFTGKAIGTRIGLSPVLRAGIGMTDAALDVFPEATVLHLGLFRDKTSLQAIEYYSKLPRVPTADLVYVLDPLVATGGTAVAAIGMLTEWGLAPSQIKLVSVLGSKVGVEHVTTEFPEVEGYISPGLGDAGDRMFNT